MSAVFLKILNMSITASWLILAVILVRLLLKKRAPKWILCVLWGLAGLRLTLPISLKSVLSQIPSSETIPANIAYEAQPSIHSGILFINEAVNPVISESFAPDPAASVNPLQIGISIVAAVWIAGFLLMLVYALISYLKLRKKLRVSVSAGEGVLACDEVKTPFILGVFRPVVYVPSSMSGEALEYVIRHEKAHLGRRDHMWKPLGFLLLAVYWFNPLCWCAYLLLCRDIEMACDEKVIRSMSSQETAAYSQALLDCSYKRTRIAACPLAFGEVGVKERIKGILSYKKPAFWIILVAILLCIALAVFLMTDPFSNNNLSGKLAVSMDMAVAEHHRTEETDGRFAAADYDVLLISKSGNETTVYAWVLYEEYSFDGTDAKKMYGSHRPAAITFDTSDKKNDSSYDVIEYWEPGEAEAFEADIQAKFPQSIQKRALALSESRADHKKCLRAAREYFGVDPNKEEIIEHHSSVFDGEYTFSTEAELGAYLIENRENDERIKTLFERQKADGIENPPMIWLPAKLPEGYSLRLIRFTTYGKYISFHYRNPGGKQIDFVWDFLGEGEATLRAQIEGFLLEKMDGLADVWGNEALDDTGTAIYSVYFAQDGYGFQINVPKEDLAALSEGGKIPLRTASYVSLSPGASDTEGDVQMDLTALREAYPEYFDLDTTKGLEVYVWQMAPQNYSFGVLSGTNREKTLEELWNLKGASAEQMKAILSAYDIPRENIVIVPWQNPISSYMVPELVNLDDEDPESAQKRRQEYIDSICKMLLGDAQIGSLVLPKSTAGIKTAVAYVNWTEGEMMHDCLNGDKMIISSVRHLPVYKLDTKEDLDRFKENYQDILTLDQGYDEVPSFNAVVSSFDEGFFADHTVILAYVAATSESFRYAIRDVSYGASTICLNVVQTNDPQTNTDDMAGWFVIAEVLDSDLADCTVFDAQLTH